MTATAPEPMRQLALNVSRLMEERELSPARVAERAGIHRSHINLILRGERMVRLDTLVKLAGALEVAPERLLDGVAWVADGRGGGEFRADEQG
jgi:transcriptional regulator with XRE-family HTH domain